MSQSLSTEVHPPTGLFVQPPYGYQSRYFLKITSGVNVAPALAELEASSHLWGQQKALIAPRAPISRTKEIWLRYRDLDDYVRKYGHSMDHFADEHESVWLSPADALPYTADLAVALAGPRRLASVLLSWVPPGGRIGPQTASSWHAEAHDKLGCALQVRPGARFCWEDGVIEAQDGDVFCFREDVPHWVENESELPLICMLVYLGKPN